MADFFFLERKNLKGSFFCLDGKADRKADMFPDISSLLQRILLDGAFIGPLPWQ